MAYLTQTDLESAMTPARVLAAFDDDNTGVVDPTALAAVLLRASNLVDGAIARSYKGTFPMASPPPALVKEAATLYAMALSIERIPEYGARYGEKHTLLMREAAEKLCERIATGMAKMVDAPPPTASTVVSGGVVTTYSPQITVSNGATSTGDY